LSAAVMTMRFHKIPPMCLHIAGIPRE